MGGRSVAGAAWLALAAITPACTQILGFDEGYRVSGAGGSGGAPLPCVVATDCPGQEDECNHRTCIDSLCGVEHAPAGAAVLSQTQGDCRINVCDGQGSIVAQTDDDDLPVDVNECTEDLCLNGTPSHPPVSTGAPCGQSSATKCDGNGNCAGCTGDGDCPVDTPCVGWSCAAGTCASAVAVQGTPCGDVGSCLNGTLTIPDGCNGAGVCQDGGTQSCAPYACSGTACATMCTAPTDCAPSHECNASQCVDCITCSEWLQNPTPSQTTNFCEGSGSVLTNLSVCACLNACEMECGPTKLCFGDAAISNGCIDCMQASCAQDYNSCVNDF